MAVFGVFNLSCRNCGSFFNFSKNYQKIATIVINLFYKVKMLLLLPLFWILNYLRKVATIVKNVATIASPRVLSILTKVATIAKIVATIEKVVATIDTTIATIASGLLRFKSTCNLRYTCRVLLHNRPPSEVAGYPARFALRDTCNHGEWSIQQ